MAEQPHKPNGNGEPPKIKLNLGKPATNPPTDKIAPTGEAPAPKLNIRLPERKSETTRIDLASAMTPPTSTQKIPPGATQKIPSGATQKIPPGATQKIPGAMPPGATQKIPGSTQKVVGAAPAATPPPAPHPLDEGFDDFKAPPSEMQADFFKKSTIRIEVPGSQPAGPPPVAKKETQKVKGETHRIDLSQAEAMKTTMRVDVTDQPPGKKETARLEVPPQIAKRQTSKIATDRIADDQGDVFKKRTMPVPVPAMPPPASSMAPTIGKPKTIQVRKAARPGAGESIIVSPPAEATAQARKSETARIDLPRGGGEERPVTRPKTIRIKRPDGTTARKALTIARPTDEQTEEAAAVMGGESVEAPGQAMPGTLYAVLALVATLVIATLTYVLTAQTYALELPFWGRL